MSQYIIVFLLELIVADYHLYHKYYYELMCVLFIRIESSLDHSKAKCCLFTALHLSNLPEYRDSRTKCLYGSIA